jgi:hypothetical protein
MPAGRRQRPPDGPLGPARSAAPRHFRKAFGDNRSSPRRKPRGIIGLFQGALAGTMVTVALLLALAVLIQNAFLMALVPLAVAGALGSSTGYAHATYMLMVSEPTITIVIFHSSPPLFSSP